MGVRLTKSELENKKQIAYVMYMSGMEQKEISSQLFISQKTISDWASAGKWKTKRAAGTITRDELVNKCLMNLNRILDASLEEDADNKGLADDVIKMANTIEKLDKKNNVVYNIETFMHFNKYLTKRLEDDKNLTADEVKKINKLQQDYVNDRIA